MMEAALVLVFGGVFLGAAILARRERLRGWERAVAARGLEVACGFRTCSC